MVQTTRLISLLVCVSLWSSPAWAGEPPQPTPPPPTPPPSAQPASSVLELTYAQALARARAEGPALAIAGARVAEAQGQVEAAGVRRLNPKILVTAGPRLGGETPTADVSVRATQWLESGGQRGHRVDAAKAQVEVSEAQREDVQRLLVREVGLAFVAALYWQRRVAIATDKLELAEAAETVARRRHEVGDVGGLEESSASLAAAHARVEVERARAARGLVEGELTALLGFGAGTRIEPVGDLRELALSGGAIEREGAGEGAGDIDARPDLRALEAQGREAQAMGELGRSQRAPRLAVGVGYAHEESEHVVLGVVGISLPVFDRGQGKVAVAEARGARVDAQLDAARNTAAVAADTVDAFVRRTSEAARQFERDGLAQLERTAKLTTTGYEKGAVAYDEVLVVRLELVAAMLDYTELLRAAATARVELGAATGALR